MKLERCPFHPEKHQFTRTGVRRAATAWHGLRWYRCKGCGWWHLTSQSAAVEEAWRRFHATP